MKKTTGNPVTGWAELATRYPFENREELPPFLVKGPTRVMGVLNVTPNSFSDARLWLDEEKAIEHGKEMLDQGADIIDIGGQSTAPGRPEVTPQEEQKRIMVVVKELAATGAVVSVDTIHAETATAAVCAGAQIINDVSGGRFDKQMLPTIAELQKDHPELSYVLQHWRADAKNMDNMREYKDLTGEVLEEISQSVEKYDHCGAQLQRLIIDPGLGFSKMGDQDWEILRKLDSFTQTGFPVLVGPSRKRFTAKLAMPKGTFEPLQGKGPWHERDTVTNVISTWCALRGVWAVRVHNPALAAIAVRAAWALKGDNEQVQAAPWIENENLSSYEQSKT